jgi:hypothetical protein
VKRGDVGIIEGPAIGCKDADAANKVTVDFGAGKRYYMDAKKIVTEKAFAEERAKEN